MPSRNCSLGLRQMQAVGRQFWMSLLLLAPMAITPAQESATNEYQVKAAYLFNFVKFVEWPANIFPSVDTPVEICVVGANPFGHALEDSIAGKIVDGRRVEIVHLSRGVELKSCQILFISSSEKAQIPEILQKVAGASVLTVGDTSGFTKNGGIINFVLDGERVRFDANVEAAGQAHLKLSARLLTIARAVVGNPPTERH
jgi:hypothetical protein